LEKQFHSAADVERMLLWFERLYGISSEDFYERHVAGGGDLDEMTGFHRHVWASMYRDGVRLGCLDSGFAARAERALALV
jgi:hypothetical protein